MKNRIPPPRLLKLPAALAGAVALTLSGCGDDTPPKTETKVQPAAPAPQAAAPAAPVMPAPGSERSSAPQEAANAALAARVKSALVAEPLLKAHGIDVVARDGAVTLFGTAESKMKREMAEKVAKAVPGVKSVENRLAVVAGS